jgi:hypothetical protein
VDDSKYHIVAVVGHNVAAELEEGNFLHADVARHNNVAADVHQSIEKDYIDVQEEEDEGGIDVVEGVVVELHVGVEDSDVEVVDGVAVGSKDREDVVDLEYMEMWVEDQEVHGVRETREHRISPIASGLYLH